MSREEMKREIRPDPVLGAALRWVEGDAPLEEVEWEALRSTLRERAAVPLARRRRAGRVEHRWMRPLVPLAVAAGIAGVAWLGGLGREGPEPVAERTVATGAQVTPEEALFTDLSEQEFRLQVSGRSDPDHLLMIAATAR